MKKIISILAALALAVSIAGCNGQPPEKDTDDSTTTTASEKATDTDKPADTADTGDDIDYSKLSEDEIRQLMIERSLMSVGDTSRIKLAMAKAERGEEVTIAYIGGSITYGYTVEPDQCWAKLTYDWMCEKYPDTKINYVNAGISGTPSVLGNVRAERDVTCFNPDIVFVEFAVNDAQNIMCKQNYESMVKTFLSLENNPAVVLLFTVLDNGYTCQEQMSAVGENYDLPMISVDNALRPELDAGRMKWEDYGNDGSHPNPDGHKLIRDMIVYCFEQSLADGTEATEANAVNETPIYSDEYMNMHFTDRATLEVDNFDGFSATAQGTQDFPNSWMRKGNEGTMTFKLKFKSLFMVFLCNNSDIRGTVSVKVDGKETATVISNTSDGWNNPVAQLVYNEKEETASEHTVEISMIEGDEGKVFEILGFGYCD